MLLSLFLIKCYDSNVPAARDQGLEDDLGIDKSSNQYQTILSILYVGYILMRTYNLIN